MVDRITPATTDEDRALVTAHQGYVDADAGAHRAVQRVGRLRPVPGRPAPLGGGRGAVVDDVSPFEQRKLWLLNGSHSLLAYAGSIRGHATIDEAVADPACRAWVEALWDEAAPHLALPADAVTDYRPALLDRFANPRVRHRLAQIAGRRLDQARVRILPVLRAERAAGRLPTGCATALAAWVLHLRGAGRAGQRPGRGTVPGRGRRRGRDSGPRGAGCWLDHEVAAGLGSDDELVSGARTSCRGGRGPVVID